ncbi:MAG: acyltransferase [Alteromonadaceae bacterium TMED7]|nr:hypothetical protein [Alteromonadaceae bacterium]RPH17376.1 MAG: acyltransferase [Alteromonadaceae bacterium TMED7]
MKFREDINALRAIAVVSVVLFHFNHEWLPGGFAGVDVFFVISGFLIAYFGESERSFRFYPITFSSSFSSLLVLP